VCETTVYNIEAHPKPGTPIDDPDVETRYAVEIARYFAEHDAPSELFKHFDVVQPNVAIAGE